MEVKTIPILILVIASVTCLDLQEPRAYPVTGDANLNFTGIAKEHGFSAEEWDVTTEDGYILKLFHIPGDVKQTVLLGHGITATSDCWIIRGEGSLAITLAKKGYDVWALNFRGNRYSRRHVSLNPDKQPDRFFNFSFYELGIYDFPAIIDFVLKKTGQKQLATISHSMGTTVSYVMGAERPEYNEKVKLAISLAPICYLEHVKGLTQIPIAVGDLLNALIVALNGQELLSYEQSAPVLQKLCLQPTGYALCIQDLLLQMMGPDSDGLEEEFIPTLLGHNPAGTTRKILEHFNQLAHRKVFARYDYGLGNLAAYKSLQPPNIDLNKATMKFALLVGNNDYLATVEDSKILKATLPNVVEYLVLPYEKFNHVDFVWGRYMPINLFPYILDVLNKHS